MNNISGFYMPASQSYGYTREQRDEQGSNLYDKAIINTGIEKQKALQNLQQNYDATINNAYASYLANQRSINESAMGEGYKNLYMQAQQQALQQQLSQVGQSVAETRQQLESSVSEQQDAINQQFTQNTANMDRIAASMNDYLSYVNSLQDKDHNYIYKNTTQGLSAEQLYGTLTNLTPTDAEGGMKYTEWVRNNYLQDNTADNDWFNWLMSGGWNNWQNAVKQSKALKGYNIEDDLIHDTDKELNKVEKNAYNIIEKQKKKNKDTTPITKRDVSEKVQELASVKVKSTISNISKIDKFGKSVTYYEEGNYHGYSVDRVFTSSSSDYEGLRKIIDIAGIKDNQMFEYNNTKYAFVDGNILEVREKPLHRY